MRPETARHVESIDQIGLAVDGDGDGIVIAREKSERKIQSCRPMACESDEALGNDLSRERENDALAFHPPTFSQTVWPVFRATA